MIIGKCCVCGKEYEVCSTCTNIKTYKPWRTICDTKEHYQVYLIVKDYNLKNITKSQAKEMLSNINFDTNSITDYNHNVQKVLKKILNTYKAEKQTLDDKDKKIIL